MIKQHEKYRDFCVKKALELLHRTNIFSRQKC